MFRNYLKELRHSLDNSNNKDLRGRFFNGGIKTSEFLSGFKKYLKANYKWGGLLRLLVYVLICFFSVICFSETSKIINKEAIKKQM